MLRISTHGPIAALAAAALLTGGAGSANAAQSRDEGPAPVMALGQAAPPPLGFLDLCLRAQSLCAPAGTTVPDLATLRAAALQQFWITAFARPRPAPAASAPEARYDWSRTFASQGRRPAVRQATRTPIIVTRAIPTVIDPGGALAADDAGSPALDTQAGAMTAHAASAADAATETPLLQRTPNETVAAAAAPPAVYALDRDGWKLVNGVNRRINRAVRAMSDDRLYGVGDYWAVPSRGRGDCEDFVLAKREALIFAGVPAEALSIAIVETRWGESHAVLLLSSDRGEYVLDNLSPWVSRWDRVDYAWRERQRPGSPFDWVSAAI